MQIKAIKWFQIIGCFASAGWQKAHFILFYRLENCWGGGQKRMQDFLMMGLG